MHRVADKCSSRLYGSSGLVIITYGRRRRTVGEDSEVECVIFRPCMLCNLSHRGRMRLRSVRREIFFSPHGCGASASGLIESIFLSLRGALKEEKRGKTQRKRVRPAAGVIKLINLMALVAHVTSHSLTVLSLSSQLGRSEYPDEKLWTGEQENKMEKLSAAHRYQAEQYLLVANKLFCWTDIVHTVDSALTGSRQRS